MNHSPGLGAIIGHPAPPLHLVNQRGEPFDLASYQGRQAVVVYFYPKAGTTGCTAEACRFRDEYEELQDLGAEVVGVSSDSVDALRAFAASNRLPFILLSDEHAEARSAWGVPRDLWLLPGRVTSIIDRDGIVRHVSRSAINMSKHVTEAIEVLKSITPPPA